MVAIFHTNFNFKIILEGAVPAFDVRNTEHVDKFFSLLSDKKVTMPEKPLSGHRRSLDGTCKRNSFSLDRFPTALLNEDLGSVNTTKRKIRVLIDRIKSLDEDRDQFKTIISKLEDSYKRLGDRIDDLNRKGGTDQPSQVVYEEVEFLSDKTTAVLHEMQLYLRSLEARKAMEGTFSEHRHRLDGSNGSNCITNVEQLLSELMC